MSDKHGKKEDAGSKVVPSKEPPNPVVHMNKLYLWAEIKTVTEGIIRKERKGELTQEDKIFLEKELESMKQHFSAEEREQLEKEIEEVKRTV